MQTQPPHRTTLRLSVLGIVLIVALVAGVAAPLPPSGRPVEAQLPGQLTVSAGGPYSGMAGQPVFFMAQVGLGGRPPGTVVRVEWDFGDGEVGVGESTTHVYSTPGTYQVSVTAIVGTNQIATDSTTAQISGGQLPGQLTVSAGGPYAGQTGMPITFMAQVNLGGRPPTTQVQVTWDFGDGGTGVGATTTYTYVTPGTYTVTVTASVGPGQVATATTTAQIAQPSSQLTANAGGPYSGVAGQPLTVSGSASGALLGSSLQFTWSFGDGGSGSGQTTSYTYAAPGTYTITLTVTSSAGQQATATTTATIAGGSEQVPLITGCTNLPLTWPNGTPAATVAAAVSPTGVLLAIWRFETSLNRFVAYRPGAPSFANDLQTVNRLDAVFICVSSPGTLTRPAL